MDSSQNDPESSECVEIDLKTVDYSDQLLTYMDDQCLAWLYTKMSCFLYCQWSSVCHATRVPSQ